MKYRKTLIMSVALPALFLVGCGADKQSVQNNIQYSSFQKEKTKMPMQNPMLKKIYEVRITDITTQRADVSHIVSQYISLGLNKDELVKIISKDFDLIENFDYKIVAHHFQGQGHLGKRRDVYIEFFFDGNRNLNNISAYLDKSNNL